MNREFKARLQAMHHVGWSGFCIWLAILGIFAVLELMLVGLMWTGLTSAWHAAAAAMIVFLLSYLMHSNLIAFHEAAHGLLCPTRWINDGIGWLLGAFSLLSLQLYRSAHHTHHAYLATPRDEELTCGLIYTPCLFLRAFFRPGTVIRNAAVRRRIYIESVAIAVFWGLHLVTAFVWDLWIFLLLMYFAPAWLAGSLQSWRKYIEHMGVTGSTALSATRSVQPESLFGHLVAVSLFHEPFHGIHHKYPRLPHDTLPSFATILIPSRENEIPPFPNYRSALWSMLGSLRDPRVGPGPFAPEPQ
jgi:fatty acid desaturase